MTSQPCNACTAARQRDELLATMRMAVATSEDLAKDYEYCPEWQIVMARMRKAIEQVGRTTA